VYAIECIGLSKRYGQVAALSDVSFSVPSGRVVALLGPNGAGKTTALRIMTSVVRPDTGTATVNGYDVRRESFRVRQSIAVVPQISWLNHYLSVEICALGTDVVADGTCITLSLGQDPDLLPRVLSLLAHGRNTVKSMEAVSPTFEDIYLRLMGEMGQFAPQRLELK
jgi:ABC-type molybdenum transport system ATPase subunit/photorepair protein PhrA